MSEPDRSVSLRPNTLMHYQPSPLAFETKPASCVRGIPDHSLPVRVAIIGNHLPR